MEMDVVIDDVFAEEVYVTIVVELVSKQLPRQIIHQHNPIPRFAAAEVFEGFVGAGHGEGLGGGGDAVAGAELQHGIHGGGTAERGAGDGFLAHDERHGGEGYGLQHGADGVEAALRLERGDVAVPVEADVGGVEDEIKGACGFGEFVGVAGVQGAVGAELQGFGAFGVAGGEGGDVASPGAEKLEGHVAEPADADDGDAVRGPHAALDDGIEHGDAAAEKRAGLCGVERLGERADPRPVGAHPGCKSAVALDDGALGAGAEIWVAREARGAGSATAGEPAEADAVADFEALGVFAEGDDFADDFVAGDERVGGHAPFVVEHGEVAVADAATLHGNLDLPDAERAGCVFKRL